MKNTKAEDVKERPTPSALRRNILAVLNQPRYQQASRWVAAQMAAAPGFTGLADIVEQLVAGPTRLAADNPACSTSVD
jgi:UDP:flavonoid glycosyltransferase YjiC (YdhE family)